MNPDASTIAAAAPIEVDLTPIADGQVIKVFWRGKPIYINHRTKKQIEEAQNVDVAKLPDPQPDSARVKPVMTSSARSGSAHRLHPDRPSRSPTVTAPATARSTTPPAASAGPARNLACLRTSSCPTPRSASADGRTTINLSRFDHERTSTYQPQSAFMRWMERRLPIAGLVYSSFVVSDAAQPELLVDLRRRPRLHARRADRHRHRAAAVHRMSTTPSIPSSRSCET